MSSAISTAKLAIFPPIQIAHHVPEDGDSTIKEIARDCELDVDDVQRCIRVAIACHIFMEIGSIAQTVLRRGFW